MHLASRVRLLQRGGAEQHKSQWAAECYTTLARNDPHWPYGEGRKATEGLLHDITSRLALLRSASRRDSTIYKPKWTAGWSVWRHCIDCVTTCYWRHNLQSVSQDTCCCPQHMPLPSLPPWRRKRRFPRISGVHSAHQRHLEARRKELLWWNLV